MALTVDVVEKSVFGRMKVAVADCTFDSSYATGGETLLPATLGMNAVLACLLEEDADGYVVKYDRANNKLMLFTSAGFTPAGTISKPSFTVEAAGAIGANMEVGLSADSAAATYEGGAGITAQRTLTTTSPVGVPTLTGTAVAAAALSELAAASNASTVVVRVVAIGV